MSKKSKGKPDAFASSERKKFNDIKLQPWTADRSIAAQALGLKYPNLSKEDWEAVKRGGIYPGAVRDIALAMWLCTLSSDQVIDAEINGEREAKKLSAKWAGDMRIHDPSKAKFWDAMSYCIGMWNEVSESITVPAKAEPTEEGTEPGNE